MTALNLIQKNVIPIENIIAEIEKRIPNYYIKQIKDERNRETEFMGIYEDKNNKLVSIVSKKYVLYQSKDILKEVILQLKDYKITDFKLSTTLKVHYLYLRADEIIEQYNLIAIFYNSVDKTHAVKIFAGVFVKECQNDLTLIKGIYIKHINEPQTINLTLNPIVIKNHIEKLQNTKNLITEDDIEKLKKVIYINDERKERLLNEKTMWDVYNYITLLISKKYNKPYFDKLAYVYNFIQKKLETW
jgi:hypothetical protein